MIHTMSAFQFILLMTFITYKPARYGSDYYFPAWADGLGWLMAAVFFVWIPATALYHIYKAPGKTIIQVCIFCSYKIHNTSQNYFE